MSAAHQINMAAARSTPPPIPSPGLSLADVRRHRQEEIRDAVPATAHTTPPRNKSIATDSLEYIAPSLNPSITTALQHCDHHPSKVCPHEVAPSLAPLSPMLDPNNSADVASSPVLRHTPPDSLTSTDVSVASDVGPVSNPFNPLEATAKLLQFVARKEAMLLLDNSPLVVFMARPRLRGRRGRGGRGTATGRGTKRAAPDADDDNTPTKRLDVGLVPPMGGDAALPHGAARTFAEPTPEDAGLVVDQRTPHLQSFFKWRDDGLDSKPGADVRYTPPPGEARHILDMYPLAEDVRNYVLLEDEIALYQHTNSDGTIVEAWKLRAQNEADNTPPFDLFTEPELTRDPDQCKCKYCAGSRKQCDLGTPCSNCRAASRADECHVPWQRILQHNWLTKAVCDNKDMVVRLGQICVDILNRAPFDPETDTWSTPKKLDRANWLQKLCMPPKKFVRAVSIVEWRKRDFKDLDFNTIPPWSLGPSKEKDEKCLDFWEECTYGKPLSITEKSKGKFSILIGATTTLCPLLTGNMVVNVTPAEYFTQSLTDEEAKVINFDDFRLFASFWSETPSQPDLVQLAKKDASIRTMLFVAQKMGHAIIGLVGAPTQIRYVIDQAMAEYLIRPVLHANRVGPLNDGASLVNTPRMDHGRAMLRFSSPFNQELTKHVPVFYTYILDRACLSYVLQAAHDALRARKSPMWIVFDTAVALQRVESGLITRGEIIDQALQAFDAQDPDLELIVYVCMSCNQPAIGTLMKWVRTVNGPLLCCAECAVADFALERFSYFRGLRFHLSVKVRAIFEMDSKHHDPTWTQDEMLEHLLETHTVPGQPNQAVNDYSAVNIDVTASDRSARGALDKVHQQTGGSLHAIGQVAFITDDMNRLKGTGAVSTLPLIRHAAYLREEELAYGTLGQDYHPAVQEEWRRHERAQDHQRIVSSLTSISSAARLQDAKTWRTEPIDIRIRQMEKSGIWDFDLVTQVGKRQLFRTKGHNRKYSSKWNAATVWSEERYQELVNLIKEMEANEAWNPLASNRERRRIIWKGKDQNIPWFWIEDHCCGDEDLQWLYREYSSDFKMMDEKCDPDNPTQESPDTLLLHDARQFLLDGGRCHVWGFKKTRRIGYTTTSSKGRGVDQTLADGTIRDILPGEWMRTGWTKLHPTSLSDFDVHNLSIIDESIAANLGRWNYPPGPGPQGNRNHVIPMLRQHAKDLYPACRWYDGIPEISQLRPIPGPSTCRNQLDFYRDFCRDKTFIASNTGDVDEEAEMMTLLLQEIMAARTGDGGGGGEGLTTQERLDIEVARVGRIIDLGSDGPEIERLLQQLKGSVDDEAAFMPLLKELQCLLDKIEAQTGGGNGGGGPPPVPCFVCGTPVDDFSIYCTTPEHQERKMHFACLGFAAQPPVEDWKCPCCKAAERPPEQEGPVVPILTNLYNLGQSCYCSSSLIYLWLLPEVNHLIMDPSKEIARASSTSGRNAVEWLPAQRGDKIITTPGHPQQSSREDIEKADSENMLSIRKMVHALRGLFKQLGGVHAKPRIEKATMLQTFNNIKGYQNKFKHDEQADAVEFFTDILTGLIQITDTSTAPRRNTPGHMIDDSVDGYDLPPLGVEASRRLEAFKAQGRATELFDLFGLQYVKESQCQSCEVVHRTWAYDLRLWLGFDATESNLSLTKMIEEWGQDSFDADNVPKCSRRSDGKPCAAIIQKRLLTTPKYLTISFTRGVTGSVDYGLNPVDISEYLSLHEAANGAELPSDQFCSNSGLKVDCIYRLIGVIVFHPSNRHYVAYAAINGSWCVFDDMSTTNPRKEHPQRGFNKGGIAYLCFYEKLPGQKSLPISKTSNERDHGFLLVPEGEVPSFEIETPLWKPMNDDEAKAAAEKAKADAERAKAEEEKVRGQRFREKAIQARDLQAAKVAKMKKDLEEAEEELKRLDDVVASAGVAGAADVGGDIDMEEAM